MFCNQCQEAARGTGCDKVGVCGKTPEVSAELDGVIARLIRLSRGAVAADVITPATARLVADGLFLTVTNVNFDADTIRAWEARVDTAADAVNAPALDLGRGGLPACDHEDIQSLRELVLYGLKGMAAYDHHAAALDRTNPDTDDFMVRALCACGDDTDAGALTALP